MAEIVWSDEAKLWLKEIYEYISLDNEAAAYQTISGVYDKATLLITHPHAGYQHEYDDLPPEIKIILYGHYRIAYRIRSDKNIDIVGVYHGSLDIKRHLSP